MSNSESAICLSPVCNNIQFNLYVECTLTKKKFAILLHSIRFLDRQTERLRCYFSCLSCRVDLIFEFKAGYSNLYDFDR